MGCDLCALTLSTLGHAIGGMSLHIAANGIACWVAHSLSFADATTLAQSDIMWRDLSGLIFTASDTAVCSADALLLPQPPGLDPCRRSKIRVCRLVGLGGSR